MVSLLAGAARAAVPQLFTVQGVWRDAGGKLQSSLATVTLNFYAAQTASAGETLLAQRVDTKVQATGGLFTMTVPVDGMLATALAEPEVWMEMTVNSDTFPRQRVTPDVYALVCGVADELAPTAVVHGAQLEPGSVAATALAPSITTPQWQAVTFTAGGKFTNYGASFNPAGYYLDPFGVVHLRGLVNYNGSAAGSIMFTLPESLRPANQWLVPAVLSETVGGVSQTGIGRIDIHTNGEVQINVYSKNVTQWVSLDGITFTLN
jgi:hypothetical protein